MPPITVGSRTALNPKVTVDGGATGAARIATAIKTIVARTINIVRFINQLNLPRVAAPMTLNITAGGALTVKVTLLL